MIPLLIVFMLQQQQIPIFPSSSGVNATPTGIVRIDSYTCYSTVIVGGMQQTTPKVCPVRIEIGEDVPDKLVVCRATSLGQTCKELGSLFPHK